MRIESLSLLDFRNFETLEIGDLSPTVNVISAPNATGKSNLLEAIYMLSMGASPRTSSVSESIRWGRSFSRISGKIGSDELRLLIKKSGRKMFVNGGEVRPAEVRSRFSVIHFSPTDLDIFVAPPLQRRRFLNELGSRLIIEYSHTLSSYTSLLAKRNSILKSDVPTNPVVMDSLEEAMADFAARLMLMRSVIIARLNEILSTYSMRMEYESSPKSLREILREFVRENGAECNECPGMLEISVFGKYVKDLREKLRERYSRMREKESLVGFSLFGPQRDDFAFFMESRTHPSGYKNVGVFASRGEQRIAAVRLKLAESELASRYLAHSPVLLLDDVLSELDSSNKEIIYELLEGRQTFVTTAQSLSELDSPLRDGHIIDMVNSRKDTRIIPANLPHNSRN